MGIRDDLMALFKLIPGGGTAAQKMTDFEELIKAKAREGAEQAIPTIKAQVAQQVTPYIAVALALGAIGAVTGVAAVAKTRRRSLSGFGHSAGDHHDRMHTSLRAVSRHASTAEEAAFSRQCKRSLANLLAAERGHGEADAESSGAGETHSPALRALDRATSSAQRQFVKHCLK